MKFQVGQIITVIEGEYAGYTAKIVSLNQVSAVEQYSLEFDSGVKLWNGSSEFFPVHWLSAELDDEEAVKDFNKEEIINKLPKKTTEEFFNFFDNVEIENSVVDLEKKIVIVTLKNADIYYYNFSTSGYPKVTEDGAEVVDIDSNYNATYFVPMAEDEAAKNLAKYKVQLEEAINKRNEKLRERKEVKLQLQSYLNTGEFLELHNLSSVALNLDYEIKDMLKHIELIQQFIKAYK